MKKIKPLLFMLLIPLLTGCGNEQKKDDDDDDKPKSEIVLHQNSVNIVKFNGAQLTWELVNIENPVVWSSDNESIATVKDGYVYGTGVGTCTITLSAGDKAATCSVTVESNSNAAVLHTGKTDLKIKKGDSFTTDLYVTFCNEVIDIDFNYLLNPDPESKVISWVYQDYALTITGEAVGETDLIVSTTARDTLLVECIHVQVINRY